MICSDCRERAVSEANVISIPFFFCPFFCACVLWTEVTHCSRAYPLLFLIFFSLCHQTRYISPNYCRHHCLFVTRRNGFNISIGKQPNIRTSDVVGEGRWRAKDAQNSKGAKYESRKGCCWSPDKGIHFSWTMNRNDAITCSLFVSPFNWKLGISPNTEKTVSAERETFPVFVLYYNFFSILHDVQVSSHNHHKWLRWNSICIKLRYFLFFCVLLCSISRSSCCCFRPVARVRASSQQHPDFLLTEFVSV